MLTLKASSMVLLKEATPVLSVSLAQSLPPTLSFMYCMGTHMRCGDCIKLPQCSEPVLRACVIANNTWVALSCFPRSVIYDTSSLNVGDGVTPVIRSPSFPRLIFGGLFSFILWTWGSWSLSWKVERRLSRSPICTGRSPNYGWNAPWGHCAGSRSGLSRCARLNTSDQSPQRTSWV